MVYPHDCCNMRVKMLGTRAKPKPELLLTTKICNFRCRQHLSMASAAKQRNPWVHMHNSVGGRN